MFIKAVLQAILMYSMACFLLLKSLCEETEAIVARFWWQKAYGKKRLYWCDWKKLCISKDEGGLGFRSFVRFNVAPLAKQGW